MREKFYVNAEISIGFGIGLGGFIAPKLRIDPADLGKETEDKFITAATAMMREAFATARKQQSIKESIGSCDTVRQDYTDDTNFAKNWQK
jgi:hypothetical protein